MNKKIVSNYMYNTAYQLMVILLPLISMPYISKIFGVENIGIYNFSYTVVNYFIIIGQLGLNLYGRREVSYHRDDQNKLNELFSQLIVLRFIIFIIIILSYIIFIFCSTSYTVFYTYFIILIFSNMIDITWLFQGLEEFKILSIRNFIVKFINTVLIFVIIKTPDDLVKYIIIYSGSEFISQLIMWSKISKVITKFRLSTQDFSRHLKYSIYLFTPQIVTTIYTLTDKLLLGVLTNETQLGLYSQSDKIIKLAVTVIGSMGSIMMPRIANMYANGNNKEDIKAILEKTSMWCWFIGFLMIFGLIGVSRGFTSWFFGNGYEPVAYLMCIISPAIIFIGLSDVYGMQYLIPTNQSKEYTIGAAVGAIVNVILNAILIVKFQAIGSSIANVVSEFCVTLTMFVLARKTISIKFKLPIKYFIAGILMCGIIKLIDNILSPSIFATMLEGFIGCVVYVGLILFMKDQFIISLLKKILRKKEG